MRRNEGELYRYLVRSPLGPPSLASSAQAVLQFCIEQIPPLRTTRSRTWAQRSIPPLIREAMLQHVTSLYPHQKSRDVLLHFWTILYNHHLRSIILPFDLDQRSRLQILTYIGSGLFESSVCPTTILKVGGVFSDEESMMLRKHLIHCPMLTVFTHRKGCDNSTLALIGKRCPNLQELNIFGSQKVTDAGIALFFGVQPNMRIEDIPLQELNPCHKTLRFVKMRSSGVRVYGVRIILYCATGLQGIRCSSHDLLKALLAHVKMEQRQFTFNMKYVDFSSCFSILSKYLHLMPFLHEVRIGADAPPHLVSNPSATNRSDLPIALKNLAVLKSLRTLVLKDVKLEIITPMLQTALGSRLHRLDIHYLSQLSGGVDLSLLSAFCSHLVRLTVCDSTVFWSFPVRKPIFPRLELCKLLRVSYADPKDWEVIPRSCFRIRILHLEGSREMTDAAVAAILVSHRKALRTIEEFQVNGSLNRLSAKTVIRLTSTCPSLRWIGDLREWNILESQRPVLDMVCGGWEGRRNEPKEQNLEEGSIENFL